MVERVADGQRKARKPHQCFHCYREIAPGTVHGFQTNKYDGTVYTLRWHLDCEEMAEKYRYQGVYFEEGWGPLRDEMQQSGEYPRELQWWRGAYPHVVCRMELTDQLRGRP